jgi:hypothetical protein
MIAKNMRERERIALHAEDIYCVGDDEFTIGSDPEQTTGATYRVCICSSHSFEL